MIDSRAAVNRIALGLLGYCSSVNAAAPVFVGDGLLSWLATALLIPFVALVIPGSVGERVLRFFGFGFLAIVTVAAGIGLMYKLAQMTVLPEDLVALLGMSVIAAPYALIVYLYRSRSRSSSTNDEVSPRVSEGQTSSRRRPLNDA